ncbi:acetyltransferase domain-containing protein, putative [Eimeria maxima]|uniref:Acetyltransferase domain-containing protein, putative n=1 Tax=Eimeria maxima TaxID=5804 RepID=U6MIZ9_EIMMA|nr:acetyltransferase domain-containing protein, putative [Eimeria maxima]CDJ61615.1 acetyltransferase domain-containing protein, putative [Eimeria maxima]
MAANSGGEPSSGHEEAERNSYVDNGDIASPHEGDRSSISRYQAEDAELLQGDARRGFSSCASDPQLWRSVNRQKQQQEGDGKQQLHQQQSDFEAKSRIRRRSSSCLSARQEAATASVVLREACSGDAPLVRDLMKSHLRSLILPAVFYWLCRHAQDFGSFLIICCCFVPLDRMLLSLCCFLLLLLVRVVLELEQYASRGCPDLAEFDRHYLQAELNRFWVAEELHPAGSQASGEYEMNSEQMRCFLVLYQSCTRRKQPTGNQVVGCIGFIIHPSNPQEGQLVRLVVSPGSRGAGVGSRLLSCALGFAASCRCSSIEVFANSLNASSASFFRNRQFELVQVVRRKLMRGDLLRWRMALDVQGRPVEPKTDPASTVSGLHSE